MVKVEINRQGKWIRVNKFPTFAIILLVIGVIWLLNDLGIFNIDVPWIPLILIVIAIGLIINRLYFKNI